MQILPITENKYNKPAFKRYDKMVQDSYGKVLYKAATCFLRKDVLWAQNTDFLIEKYADTKKVNFFCHACSVGEEALSYALMFISKLGEKGADKFFPIFARDFDKSNIEIAKQGIHTVSEEELAALKFYTGNLYKKYVEIIDYVKSKNPLYSSQITLKIKKNLMDKIQFEQADVLSDFHRNKIIGSNTIFANRNVYPYYEQEYLYELLCCMENTFDHTATIAYGNFDRNIDIDRKLFFRGFRSIGNTNMAEKYPPNSKKTFAERLLQS